MSGNLAGIVSGALVALGYFVLGIGFIPSVVLGVAGFVTLAVVSVFQDRARRRVADEPRTSRQTDRPRRRIEADLTGLGISPEEFEAALRGGAQKLATLKRAAERVPDQAVRAKAYAVCDSVARILSDIRDDPKDLRPARKFLDYYLDATIKVVDRYVSLLSKGARSAELDEALRRAEDSLDLIKSAYDKQLAQLLENDVMDLDTELQVLERTIQMEGLGDQ